MSACVGYLRDVRAWDRFGFGSRGNLIIYGDCLVFAAVRAPFVNSVFNIRELVSESDRESRFANLAREQSGLAPDELAARSKQNWLVRTEDVVRAALSTSRNSTGPASDDLVTLVLDAASLVGAPTEHTLMIHLRGRKTPRYPSVRGVWGDAENRLLGAALGDALQ